MPSCDTEKYTCGLIVPSSCVPYTGPDLTILADPNTLSCNANVTDVITLLDSTIKGLLTGNDLVALNPRCLGFNPLTVSINGLHQIEIDNICAINASLTSIISQVNALNVGTMLISINLQCLTPAAAACLTPPSTYKLIAVLNTLVNEICALKTAVGI